MEDRGKNQRRTPESLSEALPGKLRNCFRELLMKKDRLVILLLTGILLLVIAIPLSEDQQEDAGQATGSAESGATEGNGVGSGTGEGEAYAAYLEEKLAGTLSKIQGAGIVTVMVTLESTGERKVEKDTASESQTVEETDSQGGTRSTSSMTNSGTTVYSGGDQAGSGEPYVTEEMTPRVEGVAVVAQGGGNAVVVQEITDAVQALFAIDTHKIKVMKGN